MEFFNYLLLFLAGLFSGAINVFAGGGSSLTLPVLIFLGLDGATANGTNRLAILVQSIAAVKSFKDENHFYLKDSLYLSFLTLPGAILGAVLSINISNDLFETILGIIMIWVVISMLLPKNFLTNNRIFGKPVVYTSMFLIGFYGGFIQVGVGFLLMAFFNHILKLDLIKVNVYKVFIVLIYTIPAFLIFVVSGKVDIIMGVILSAGNAIGAWWSAKLSIKKGEGVIKTALIVSIIIMALKLWNVF